MRTKIDYGIDLGTTNSAIARMENGKPIIKKTDFEFTGVIIRRNILEGFQLIEESIETDERLTEFIIFYFGKRFVNNKRLVKTSIDKIKRKYNIDVKFVQLLRDHGKIEHELIIN